CYHRAPALPGKRRIEDRMEQAVATQATITNDVSSREFWQSYAPDFHVQDVEYLSSQSTWNLDAATMASLKELIMVEGYFQLPPQQWQLPIERMAEFVSQLERDGLPLPFCFMYDEYWS